MCQTVCLNAIVGGHRSAVPPVEPGSAVVGQPGLPRIGCGPSRCSERRRCMGWPRNGQHVNHLDSHFFSLISFLVAVSRLPLFVRKLPRRKSA